MRSMHDDDQDHPLMYRWTALFSGKQAPTAADIGFDLLKRWQEPHRVYHTIDHLSACLDLADTHCARAVDPRFVALVLWYHDAVYDPNCSDNEALSAELALNDLQWLGESEPFSQRVATAIRATADHIASSDPDIALIVDIDLAILGSEAAVYNAFEHAIRREYQHVPWAAFRRGRTQILTRFLEQEVIGQSSVIDNIQAHQNIARAIHALECSDDETTFADRLTER